jgi:hypothetical protein
MKRTYQILALVSLLAAGCILSGTFVADVEFVDVATTFVSGLVKQDVDLSDYTDHAEDIQRIDRIDLEAILVNGQATASNLDVYVSSNSAYTTKAAVEAGLATDVLPVLLDYVTKPGPNSTDTVTILEARTLLQLTGANWDAVKALLETGLFTVYVTSTDASVSGEITKATLHITFTAKP